MNIPIPDNASEHELKKEVPADKEAPAGTVPTPRNQFIKTDTPKIVQFSARATQKDADRIKEALEVRKRGDQTYDIVMLTIDMLNHIESDFLQTFRTKKKK